MDLNYKIHIGDCLKVFPKIENDSVDLIITSPPYLNDRKYLAEEGNIGRNKDYEEYLHKIRRVLIQCKRVLKPGAFLAWNSSVITHNRIRYPIPWDTARMTTEIGMEFLEDITWTKHLGATGHVRVGPWFKAKKMPTKWRANLLTELIVVHKKLGERIDLPDTWDPWLDYDKHISANHWFINPQFVKFHGVTFPKELPRRLVKLYTFKGDTVLDPFHGAGTTGLICLEQARSYIGIEISEEYVKKSLERIGWGQQNS